MKSMNKIKIIQLISSLGDGGAETLVKDYANLIDNQRFEIKIIVVQNVQNTANYKWVSSAGIQIIPVYKNYNLASKISRNVIGKYYIPHRLKSIISSEKPDVIHVHLPLLRYLSPIADSLNGIKLFYTCHNEASIMLDGKMKKEQIAASELIKKCNLQLIALHQDMAEELNNMFSVNTTKVIRNGVDFNRFRNISESKMRIRENIGIPVDALVVGHIGRFTEQKNHTFLIDIFKKLTEYNNSAFLLLVGSGKLKKSIEERVLTEGIKDKVLILSNRTDIPQLLQAMDVFVFPSLFEGLSVTLVEAQAAGVRVIASDRINKETVLSKDTILLSIKDSPAKWAQTILDTDIVNNEFGDISRFDMNKEIIALEKLYSGERY